MNALFQCRFFARNMHKMPTVSILRSTSSSNSTIGGGGVTEEKKANDDAKSTISHDVKKGEVVVPEVKIEEERSTSAASAIKESLVVVEKPQ